MHVYGSRRKYSAAAEPFRIVPLEDAVAVKQQFTDQLGLITVVTFNHGWPVRSQLIQQRNKRFHVMHRWDSDRGQWQYDEAREA